MPPPTITTAKITMGPWPPVQPQTKSETPRISSAPGRSRFAHEAVADRGDDGLHVAPCRRAHAPGRPIGTWWAGVNVLHAAVARRRSHAQLVETSDHAWSPHARPTMVQIRLSTRGEPGRTICTRPHRRPGDRLSPDVHHSDRPANLFSNRFRAGDAPRPACRTCCVPPPPTADRGRGRGGRPQRRQALTPQARRVVARGWARYGDAQNTGGLVIDMNGSTPSTRSTPRPASSTSRGGQPRRPDACRPALRLRCPCCPAPARSPSAVPSAATHGKNHHSAGSFGDHVTSMDLLVADGRVLTLTPEGSSDDPGTAARSGPPSAVWA